MKKSTMNVIILALVLINLVLTVILTFSLVSTNNKTNSLITKVAKIIDLDVGGISVDKESAGATSIDDIEYMDVTNNDSSDITISYTDSGKTHYAIVSVTLGINKKAKNYETKKTSINNGMKLIVNQVTTECLKYSYSTITQNKSAVETNLLNDLRDLFQTDIIESVLVSVVVQ
ncbi:MAG: hypothetical protein Q4F11_09040 [Eubacteriales bacterium]|nr:hypothetical protein [Eubacteriales bacterium]